MGIELYKEQFEETSKTFYKKEYLEHYEKVRFKLSCFFCYTCYYVKKRQNMIKKMSEELLKQLSWNTPKEVQEEAIKKLEKLKNLTPLFQPTTKECNKNVWENCAKIIISKTDEELIPYMDNMFEWLQDMNWPGSWEIFERTKKIPFKKIEKSFTKNLKIALQELGEEGIYLNSWAGNLIMTHLSKELFHNPKIDLEEEIIKWYKVNIQNKQSRRCNNEKQ